MFDIGFSELALVGLVALVAVRPERLPGLARSAGAWMRRVRTMVETVKADVDRELSRTGGSAGEEYQALKREFSELRAEMSRYSWDARRALAAPVREESPPEPADPPDAPPGPAAEGSEEAAAPPVGSVPPAADDGPGAAPPPPL